MKLSNLEITSEFRLTQPASGSEELQTIDIKFAIDTGASVAPEFYELLMYEMLNGFVTGVNGTVDTGLKAVYYDENGDSFLESSVDMLDKITTVKGTELIADTVATKTDDGTTVYITRIDLIYIANDNNVADEKLVFTSVQPQKIMFAEDTDVTGVKGIAIPTGDGSATLLTNFVLKWST